MKELINKRESLIKQAEEMRNKLNDEKRTSFTAEERTGFEKIKNDINELNARIEDEKFVDEQKRSEATKLFNSKNERKETGFNLERAFRNFATRNEIDKDDEQYMFEQAEKDGVKLKRGQLYISVDALKQRAEKRAQTTSNSSALGRVFQAPDLSFVPYPILYNQIGCRVYEGLQGGGNLDLVSMANYSVTFGTENNTISDASLTPAKATLVPAAVNATASFSRELLGQSNPDIVNQIVNTFATVIDAAIDKRMMAQLSGLTNTITGASTYANILTLEANINAVPSAFLASFKGRNYLKSKIRQAAATDSHFIWDDDNTVASYSAFASPQMPNGLYVLGNFADVAVGKWGGLVIIEDPYSNKRNNLVDYSVIQMADCKVVNSQSFAKTSGGSYI